MTPADKSDTGQQHDHIDMDAVYAHVAVLPDDLLTRLEMGPRPVDTECNVCRTFEFPQFSSDPVDEHVRWLSNFHGMSAMRCGVIYGMAKALRRGRWEASIERMRRENPEAYR